MSNDASRASAISPAKALGPNVGPGALAPAGLAADALAADALDDDALAVDAFVVGARAGDSRLDGLRVRP